MRAAQQKSALSTPTPAVAEPPKPAAPALDDDDDDLMCTMCMSSFWYVNFVNFRGEGDLCGKKGKN